MNRQSKQNLTIFGLVALNLFPGIAFAQGHGVIDGGGTQTVTEARGQALVQNHGAQSLVYISGKAARVLYEGLKVKVYNPPSSSSMIKSGQNIECVQNPGEYNCTLAVKN